MARKWGAVVEKITHDRTKRTAEIRLNKGSMEFFCEIGGDRFESKDGGEVKKWALKILGSRTVVDWTPVIRVFVSSDERRYWRQENAGLEVTLDRFWVAQTPAKAWYDLAWEEYERLAPELRLENAKKLILDDKQKMAVPCVERVTYGLRHYLPYSDAAWVEARALLRMIRRARGELNNMIADQGIPDLTDDRSFLVKLEHRDILAILAADREPLEDEDGE